MTPDWHAIDWRSVVFTVIALVVAWLAWNFSPRLTAMLGLNDLELLGQLVAVVLSLSVVDMVFSRLPGAEPPAH